MEVSSEGLDDGSGGESSSAGEDSVVVEGNLVLREGDASSSGKLSSSFDVKGESDDSCLLLRLLLSDFSFGNFEVDSEGVSVGQSRVSLGVESSEVQRVSGKLSVVVAYEEAVPVSGHLPDGVIGSLLKRKGSPSASLLHI